MIRSAAIVFLVSCCAFLCSQTPHYSREFDAFKKNVPLAIINTHPNYFHLLRYNKDAHDFTLERRSKPSAEMIRFNPLKLDQINADWFNYEHLDFLLFENNHKVCFVFEKVVNTKREIYLKIIDTLGQATNFTQLAVLEKEKATEEFSFEMFITQNNNLLIIGTQIYINGVIKKTALLYDPAKQEKVWLKKLPFENSETGTSAGFECNANGDLFYALLKPRIASYKRKYADHQQQEMPVFAYESKALVAYLKEESQPRMISWTIPDLHQVFNLNCVSDQSSVSVFLHFTKINEAGEESIFFLTEKWDNTLTHPFFRRETPLSEENEKQLTYYDGTDYNTSADKTFNGLNYFRRDTVAYILSEHKDDNSYKELLLVKINLNDGMILDQELIPRKFIFYTGRSRFKNMSGSNQLMCYDDFHSILLESARNADKTLQNYKYKKYARANGLRNTNIVSYILKADGHSEKKQLFTNDNYECILLPAQHSNCDVLLYLTNGVYEKFATWKLNP